MLSQEILLNDSGIEKLKKVVVAILLANRGRQFSTRTIHKAVYNKLVELKELRDFLGRNLVTHIEEVTANIYGPTMPEVSAALTELVAEGTIGKSEFQTVLNDKLVRGRIFYPKNGIGFSDLGLPMDITRFSLPACETTEQSVTRAKEDLTNRLAEKNYKWKESWNARLAYTLFRQTRLVNNLITQEEAAEILDLMHSFDQSLQLPKPNGNRCRRDAMLPDIRSFIDNLMEILQCESLSEHERVVAETMKEWVSEFAASNDLQQSLQSRVDEDGNLLVVLKGQNVEKIVFLFHLDTVKGYFPPKLENGHIYGRGAVDNKCQGMAAIYSLMLLAANGIVPPFSVVVMGVTCEEIPDPSKRGILKAIKRYGLSRENTPLVVVLEATNMNIAIGQRQRWTGKIEVYGLGVHSAHVYQDEVGWIKNKANGKIDAHLRFPDLRALVSRASGEIRAIPLLLPNNGNGKLGKTNLTLSEAFEDTTGNQTPSSGILSFDVRLGDQDSKDNIGKRIREVLHAWLPCPFGFIWNQEMDDCTGTADFLGSEIGSHIKILLERLKPFFDLFGAKPTTYEFGVDGRYTVEAGIPTIGLAPGEERYAHRAYKCPGIEPEEDMLEKIRISEMLKAIIVYATLIQLCTYHRTYEGLAEIRPAARCFSTVIADPSSTYVT